MTVAVVLLTTALVIADALLAAAGADKLARMDGATYPTAVTRAAVPSPSPWSSASPSPWQAPSPPS